MIFWRTFLRDEEQVDKASDIVSAIEYQLQVLLSSEAPLRFTPKQYQHVRQSNLCFGLDNFQSVSGQMDSMSFARQIEYWIKLFEPRLQAVTVEMQPRNELRNQIGFSVQAQLLDEGRLHELAFNSHINLTSQQAELEEQGFV